jgi:hypothetical protein
MGIPAPATSGARAAVPCASTRATMPLMHAWLVRLTRPEDPILWIGVAIALGYAAVGVILGVRARRAGGPGSS